MSPNKEKIELVVDSEKLIAFNEAMQKRRRGFKYLVPEEKLFSTSAGGGAGESFVQENFDWRKPESVDPRSVVSYFCGGVKAKDTNLNKDLRDKAIESNQFEVYLLVILGFIFLSAVVWIESI